LTKHPADKIILALDGMDRDDAISFSSKIPELRWVKVGLELFLNGGPDVLLDLREKGLRVFLDLKFHDIPTTMANACGRAASNGVDLITVHSCAGIKALKDSKVAAEQSAFESGFSNPRLLAVTVLTSWDTDRLNSELGIHQSVESRVHKMASLAAKAGLNGCVCSPLEVRGLRKKFPNSFDLVTPGIRPAGSDSDDQSRVTSPAKAIQDGASLLVIGRPITRSPDPRKVFMQCCEEIE